MHENYELKVKLWWGGARERKKSAFFVTFILSEGNFFNVWVLSQCLAYWINFENLHAFTYLKTLLHTLLLLVYNPLSVSPTKCSNALKQFVGNTKFTGKHRASGVQLYWKRDSSTGVFLWFLRCGRIVSVCLTIL